jgi:hypothetical protein
VDGADWPRLTNLVALRDAAGPLGLERGHGDLSEEEEL